MHWIQDVEDIRQLLTLLAFVAEYGELTKAEVAGVLPEPDCLINTALLTGTLHLAPDGRLHPTHAGRNLVGLAAQGCDKLAAARLALRLPFYRHHFLLDALGSGKLEAEAPNWVRAWQDQADVDPFTARRQLLQSINRYFLRGVSRPLAWRWLKTLEEVTATGYDGKSGLPYLSETPTILDLYALVPRLAEPGYDRFGFLDTLECVRLYVLIAHVLADQIGAVVHTDRLLTELAAFREADLDVETGWDHFEDYVASFAPLGVYVVTIPGTARSSLLNLVEMALVPASNMDRLLRTLGTDSVTPDTEDIVAHLRQRGILTHDQAGVGTNRSHLTFYSFPPSESEAYSFADWLSEGSPLEKARPVVLPRNLLTVETLIDLWEDDGHRPSPGLIDRSGVWGELPLYSLDGNRRFAWDDSFDGRQAFIDFCYQHVPHVTILVSLLLLQRQYRTALTLQFKRDERCWVVNEVGHKRPLLEILDAALKALGCDVLNEWRADQTTAMELEQAQVAWATELEIAVEEGGVLHIAPAYRDSHTGGQRLAWWHAHDEARERIWEMLSQ